MLRGTYNYETLTCVKNVIRNLPTSESLGSFNLFNQHLL